MAKKVERQIRWKVNTDTGDQTIGRSLWTFLVIDDPRNIDRIREKLYQKLSPVEVSDLAQFCIRGTRGIYYSAFTVASDVIDLDAPSKRFVGSAWHYDGKISPKREQEWFDNYVNGVLVSRR